MAEKNLIFHEFFACVEFVCNQESMVFMIQNQPEIIVLRLYSVICHIINLPFFWFFQTSPEISGERLRLNWLFIPAATG